MPKRWIERAGLTWALILMGIGLILDMLSRVTG